MRSALLIGLVVTAVGCSFPTGEFVLGGATTDVGTPLDVGAADSGAADSGATDTPLADVVQKDFPTVDVTAADVIETLDAAGDVPADLGVDVGAIDGGTDAPAMDTADDVPVDAGVDAAPDALADAGSDVPADLGTDVGFDVGSDVPRDVGSDVPRDVGTDVPVDAGPAACRTTAPFCTAPTVCSAGFCVSACPSGQTACNGACIDLRTNRSNCGLCGRACATAQVCSAGACVTPAGTYVFTSVRPSFIDACALTTSPRILPGADDAVGPVLSLPFAFRYAGVGYSTLRPSSNGYVLFGSTAESHDGQYPAGGPLPDGNRPRPAVFVLNSDLYMRTTAGICFAVVGTAPARRAVVEWLDASECCGDANPAHLTFELVLNESDGSMNFNYQSITYANSGRAFLTGVQNETATVGSTYVFSSGLMPTTPGSNTSLHVTPAP